MKNEYIAIVIPAYNEEHSIIKVLKSLPSNIKNYQIKIIVVNDGSTDNTALVVDKFKNVILINHIINSGAGAATRTGLHFAKSIGCKYIATMDADGQHLPTDTVKALKYAVENKTDLTIGSRLMTSEGMPWHKIIGNKGLSLITFLVFGVFVIDSQSGLKVFSKKAVENINFHNNGYAFCSEVIWQAHKNHLSIVEIPIKAVYTEYSISKGQSNWNSIEIVRQLVKRRIMEFING